MLTLKRTYTRPSSEILWHFEALDITEIKNHLNTAYVYTGKLLQKYVENYDTSITFTMIWADKESFELYDNDPALIEFWNDRDAYNQSNGIIMGPKIIT